MQCYESKFKSFTFLLFTLIRAISCFRSEEAEGNVHGMSSAYKRIGGIEGNTNLLMQEHEFKRSVDDDERSNYQSSRMINDNFLSNDLMVISTPAKYREKRSKNSKRSTAKIAADEKSKHLTTKDELMNILGTIRAAKHHRLSRNDIRKLARKAFQKIKQKEKDKHLTKVKNVSKTEDSSLNVEQKKKMDILKNEKTVNVDSQTSKNKSTQEDEQEFAHMFDEQPKPKMPEISEDVSKLGDGKMSELLSDDSMSKKSLTGKGKKSTSPTINPNGGKTTAKLIEQELTKELETKTSSKAKGQSKISKKNEIPDLDQKEKIKTLKTLLAKANKKKVPKKFLSQFPAGLRMIAWRELLEKKKKELEELENMEAKQTTHKKEENAAKDDKPVTIDINIDPTSEKVAQVSTDTNSEDKSTQKKTESDHHHMASHVKYLQKHLSSIRDLRKLISRALIGHCHTTGKRILKAFVAMDRALTRAQNIATVIGKKFKVDTAKIESIVVHKEDEVVESFLKDIFSNFSK